MKRYEGMFLFDNAVAREWAGVEQEVNRLCERIGAELLVCVKFDERKLAYEVQKRKRGTYVLTYFEAPPDRIGDLERDVQLSESVLRVLVLQADGLTEEKLNELKAHQADTPLQPATSERRHDDHDRGWRQRGGGRSEREGSRREGEKPEGDSPPEKSSGGVATAEAPPPAAEPAGETPVAPETTGPEAEGTKPVEGEGS